MANNVDITKTPDEFKSPLPFLSPLEVRTSYDIWQVFRAVYPPFSHELTEEPLVLDAIKGFIEGELLYFPEAEGFSNLALLEVWKQSPLQLDPMVAAYINELTRGGSSLSYAIAAIALSAKRSSNNTLYEKQIRTNNGIDQKQLRIFVNTLPRRREFCIYIDNINHTVTLTYGFFDTSPIRMLTLLNWPDGLHFSTSNLSADLQEATHVIKIFSNRAHDSR